MVRCRDCGYLAAIHKDTGASIEASPEFRHSMNKPELADEWLRCARGMIDMKEEAGGTTVQVARTKQLPVIEKERDCTEFVAWKVGYSPREHTEMLIQDDMRRQATEQRERDRQWQETVRREDLEWKTQQRRDDLEWNARQEKLTVSHFRWNVLIVGIVTLIVSVSMNFYGAWIQAKATRESAAPPAATSPAK